MPIVQLSVMTDRKFSAAGRQERSQNACRFVHRHRGRVGLAAIIRSSPESGPGCRLRSLGFHVGDRAAAPTRPGRWFRRTGTWPGPGRTGSAGRAWSDGQSRCREPYFADHTCRRRQPAVGKRTPSSTRRPSARGPRQPEPDQPSRHPVGPDDPHADSRESGRNPTTH